MPVSHAASGLSNAVSGDGERNRVSLVEMLTRLTDPRSPQGKRHDLVFVLACAVVGTLAGAANYRQLARQVADLPQSLLEKLGARWIWFRRRYVWPSEATLRRVLQRIDAAELDRLVGAWLCARAWRDADGLLVIAVDGKVLRGAWTEDNDQVTLFSAMIHQPAVTIAQIRVPDGTNEITQVKNLLDHVTVEEGGPKRVIITLDAAHTQDGKYSVRAWEGAPTGPAGGWWWPGARVGPGGFGVTVGRRGRGSWVGRGLGCRWC